MSAFGYPHEMKGSPTAAGNAIQLLVYEQLTTLSPVSPFQVKVAWRYGQKKKSSNENRIDVHDHVSLSDVVLLAA